MIVDNEIIELETKILILNDSPERYHITYHLHNEEGDELFSFFSDSESSKLRKGLNRLVCYFPKLFFQPGDFYLSLYFVENKKNALFTEKNILRYTVIDGGKEIGTYMGREPGFIRPHFEWENFTQ